MSWQKCPVCSGCGLVPPGFYDATPSLGRAAAPQREQCRACEGRGVLADHQPVQFVPTVFPQPLTAPGFPPIFVHPPKVTYRFGHLEAPPATITFGAFRC